MKNPKPNILLAFLCAAMVATAAHADGWYYNITNNAGRVDVLKMGPFKSQSEAKQAAAHDLDEGLNVGPCYSEAGDSSLPILSAPDQHVSVGGIYQTIDFESSPSQALLDKIKQTATMNPKPEIPEEARGHFIKAGTLLKEAKEQSDYELAANEYLQARNLALWWPDVYYNLALVREAEKQYDKAINDLNLYLASNPDDSRAAQDKLYQIQAEKDLAAKHAADEQAKAQQEAAQQQAEAHQREIDSLLKPEWRTNPNGLNNNGQTPLTQVIFDNANNLEAAVPTVNALLQAGADPNQREDNNFGWLPLVAAANFGNVHIVALLLEHGAQVNAANANRGYGMPGMTALQAAAMYDRVEIVNFLLEHGADVNAREPVRGWTALDMAKRWGHNDVIQILKNHGAQ